MRVWKRVKPVPMEPQPFLDRSASSADVAEVDWLALDDLDELEALDGSLDVAPLGLKPIRSSVHRQQEVAKRRSTVSLQDMTKKTQRKTEASRRYSMEYYHRNKLRLRTLKAEVARLERELMLLTRPVNRIPDLSVHLRPYVSLLQEACALRRESAELQEMQETMQKTRHDVVMCV